MDISSKKVFIIRFVIWTVLACLLPIGFIFWRFDLFKKVSGIKLSGWGIIAIIILTIFILSVARYIKKGAKFSMTIQCINGLVKITLPLFVGLLVLLTVRTNVDYFVEALMMTLICETVAIPINPFPKWIHDSKKEEKQDDVEFLASTLAEKFGFGKKEKESKGK